MTNKQYLVESQIILLMEQTVFIFFFWEHQSQRENTVTRKQESVQDLSVVEHHTLRPREPWPGRTIQNLHEKSIVFPHLAPRYTERKLKQILTITGKKKKKTHLVKELDYSCNCIEDRQ